jgi:16S rRNA (cytosine967-C5)-methyltransferase
VSATKPQAEPDRRPRRARREVDPVRLAAYDLLVAVAQDDAYANLLLPSLLRERGITGRDAAFVTELTYGALRGQGAYDSILEACLDRPLVELDPRVLAVLHLGAHQLLATRVPAHAAVASSVDIARETVGEGPARLVNAVLRRVAARPLDDWIVRLAPDSGEDPIGHLAVRHSHPAWVVQAFADALDGDLAEVSQLLAADNDPPSVTLVVRPGRAEVAELLAAGAEPGRWSPYAAVLTAGQPREVPAVAEGRAGVQDEGSQLVALALAKAETVGTDVGQWMDMCAGPGGKAALLAGLAAGRGASLLAVERQQHRTRLVRDALLGTPGRWAAITADAIRSGWIEGAFDRVLADVPCTGLGALRRRPEARWRRRPSDIAALAPLQRGLLHAAVRAARPGGLVAYVACSPHLGETRMIVNDVLATRDDVEQIDARPYIEGVPDLGDGPHVQLWPHRHGTDAMFLALLRRTTT